MHGCFLERLPAGCVNILHFPQSGQKSIVGPE
jgi:hypothetical protein